MGLLLGVGCRVAVVSGPRVEIGPRSTADGGDDPRGWWWALRHRPYPRQPSYLAVALGLPLLLTILAFFEVGLCPLRVVSGVPCPGCGLTRAAMALFHLDLPGIWRAHPLAFVILPWVFYEWVRTLLKGAGAMPRASESVVLKQGRWFWVGVLAVMVVVWVVRLALGVHPDVEGGLF